MRYVTTSTGFYTDPDIGSWKPLTRYYYRYLYENEHAHGSAGVGRIHPPVEAAETGMTTDEIGRARAEIGQKVRWYPDGTYWVVARIKHTCIKGDGSPSPRHVDSVRILLNTLSDDVTTDIIEQYPMLDLRKGYRRGIQGVSKGHHRVPTESVAVAVTESVAVTDNNVSPAKPASTPVNTGQQPSTKKPSSRSREKPASVNAWKLWVDAHRDVNLPDPVTIGKDLAAGKALAKAIPDAGELRELMDTYLADEDQWLMKQGHPLSILPSRINAYRAAGSMYIPTPSPEQMKMIVEMEEAARARGEYTL
jgi:hypothetical protein